MKTSHPAKREGKSFDLAETRAYITGVLLEHCADLDLRDLGDVRDYAGGTRLLRKMGIKRESKPHSSRGGGKSPKKGGKR